ncbi:MAG: BMP family ABC transporter substrate-binding protein [Treponema sp.]|jgi:simple sugar transport system substrate-binding protein|nr:BMP family ABC transporter substrate-binding protein [Treponema sp.]
MKQHAWKYRGMPRIMLVFSLLLWVGGSKGFGLGSNDASTKGSGDRGLHPSIAVFIPGVMSGSPIYEMLAEGVKQGAAEKSTSQRKITVTVIEGGFNQAEWESRITALAASGSYDLIVSSNPSLPAIAASVSAKFPKQRFLLLDGALTGNPQIYTLRYKQREQAYMAGHIAALVAKEAGHESSPGIRVGLVAGQEYPAMNEVILPGYREGAQQVDPKCTVDFRVVGNWFDAGKGAELAADMIRGGVKVILTIAGGANEGVVQAAFEAGAKVVWFDTNGYGVRPGTVVGSAVVYQDKAAYEQTIRFLDGTLPFGKAELLGVAEGYVDFIEADSDYQASVSAPIREKQRILIEQIRSGVLQLEE